MKNIGEVSSGWLREVGVYSRDDLIEVGAIRTYKLLKDLYPKKVSLNLLWGLEAAILDIHWREITPEMKAELKAQL